MGDGVSSRGGTPSPYHSYGTWMNNPAGGIAENISWKHNFFLNSNAAFPIHQNNITLNVGCCYQEASWSSILLGGLANIGIKGLFLFGMSKLFRGGFNSQKPKFALNTTYNQQNAYWNRYFYNLNLGNKPVTVTQTQDPKKETTPDKVNNPDNVDNKDKTKDTVTPNKPDEVETPKVDEPKNTDGLSKAKATATNGDNDPISGDSEIKDGTGIRNEKGETDANGQFPDEFTITDDSSGNPHVYTFTFIKTDGDNVIYKSTLTKVIVKDENAKNKVAGKPVKYSIPKSEFKNGKFADERIESGHMVALPGEGTNVHKSEFAAKGEGSEVTLKAEKDDSAYSFNAEA